MAAIERADAQLERRGLHMSMVFGARHDEHFPDGLPWTCTLRYQRRRITIAYYTHPGLEYEPTAAEVLASLLKDASTYEHAPGFIEFCTAVGYERDRRRSEWTYVACRDAAARLHHLLAGDYAGITRLVTGIK